MHKKTVEVSQTFLHKIGPEAKECFSTVISTHVGTITTCKAATPVGPPQKTRRKLGGRLVTEFNLCNYRPRPPYCIFEVNNGRK